MNPIRLTNTFKSSILLFLVGVMSCNKLKNNDASRTLDRLPFNTGDIEPKLGDAYDSLVQELRNTPLCVEGTTAKLNSHSSSINLQKLIGHDNRYRSPDP